MQYVRVREYLDSMTLYDGPFLTFDVTILNPTSTYVFELYEDNTLEEFFAPYGSDKHTVLGMLRDLIDPISDERPVTRMRTLQDFARLTGHPIDQGTAYHIVDHWKDVDKIVLS